MVLCEPEGLNFADMCDITPIMASEASPEEKIAQLRSAFFQSSRLASKGTTQIWESHRDQPEFLLGVSKYVQRTLSELLRQKPIEVVSSAEKPVSVYDEIEFCVFLLGASGNLDILEDLKTNDCVEFANLMSRYRVEIERLVHEKTSMDENISAFIE
jgi:hypothetical protein